MTSLAIMQPYFLPYIGYFRLFTNAERFIFLDNAYYINKGWVNRNRLLINNKSWTFTIPLNNASQNKLINELTISYKNYDYNKLLKSIYYNYKKSPQFEMVYPLAERIFKFKDLRLINFIINSFIEIFQYLKLPFKFDLASNILEKKCNGEEYIINLCRQVNATVYLNASGGKHLYNENHFLNQGIKIMFLGPETFTYSHPCGNFIQNLSILDVIMFNDKNKICNELLYNNKLY